MRVLPNSFRYAVSMFQVQQQGCARLNVVQGWLVGYSGLYFYGMFVVSNSFTGSFQRTSRARASRICSSTRSTSECQGMRVLQSTLLNGSAGSAPPSSREGGPLITNRYSGNDWIRNRGPLSGLEGGGLARVLLALPSHGRASSTALRGRRPRRDDCPR
jgi:hypothetical protein